MNETESSRNDVWARALRALELGDAAAALEALSPLAAELAADRELAELWISLLREVPAHPGLVAEAGRVLERWPDCLELVLPACDALIRCAGRLPIDVAQPADGAAALAARAAERCLQSAAELEPETEAYLRVCLGNAQRLLRDFEPALAAFERALAIDPERGGWWFNLGLLHKARGCFEEGLGATVRARSLLGNEKRVLWNLAICAVACGKGEQAAEAFAALGHAVERRAVGLPTVLGLPPVQVRVASVGSGYGAEGAVPDRAVGFELLWATPLSPCHGVISSASYRVASVDYGDVVLWDGVPVGIVEHEGKTVPRFPLLAVLHRGTERRYRFVALQQQPGCIDELAAEMPDGCELFVHNERIEHDCPRCLSGEHARAHAHMPAEPHHLVYGKIVVAADRDLGEVRVALEQLLRRHSRVQLVLPGLLEDLGDSASAGKAHQAWRGLERSGLRARARG